MRKGFFSTTKQSRKPPSKIPRCGLCGLRKQCNTPKMEVDGLGGKKILAVGEYPTAGDDDRGKPFTGSSGQLLEKALSKAGISMHEDCWLTNAIICNGVVNDENIHACYPNLAKTIKKLDPVCIIVLGTYAVKSLIGNIWKEDVGTINKWAGYSIPSQNLNSWITCTYNPIHLLKNEDVVATNAFFSHIKQGIKKARKRPWKQLPDYNSQIDIIYEAEQVREVLQKKMKTCKAAAFDYETNCLKPDSDDAEIISCSICFDGKTTIAFPFSENIKPDLIAFFRSKIPKIACNLKFEERWTKAKLGINVRNWYWDTMIAAHVLDNRSGITSIKFQSYVQLGAPSYDGHIKPYLTTDNKTKYNKIKQLPMKELLYYNGLDSLLEYKVAMKQIKKLHSK